ncbi:MAG TPA: helix-turn-helix transcriptional regulator, partial [Micromonosporaceae bacterium]
MTDVGSAQRLRHSVAEEVRVAMVRRKMNGAGLAVAIGRSQAYVSRRLTGETPFDVDDLERIAVVLGVDVADLVRRNEGG